MPNIDTLIESIQSIFYCPEPQNTIYFSTLDLKYVYSQINLYPTTANYCNFNIISGDMTGTYRFQTGFYGLTEMPAEKAMDYTLIRLKNTYCFLDDILIVSERREEEHKEYFLNCLKRFDEDHLRIILLKCHFSKLEIDWLGYHISQSGISPLEGQTSAILTLETPKTIKNLIFLGAVHYIIRFIPTLAQISHPLRPLLEKSAHFVWTDVRKNWFSELKSCIAIIVENIHYNPQLETRVKSDASFFKRKLL